MGLIHKLRNAWINFVTDKDEEVDGVTYKRSEWGSLVFPTTAESEDEKYDHISEACRILEDEIKIVKPKLKSKTKSK